MTVASTTNRKSFSGDGVTTSFGTSPVVFYESTDLVVEVYSSAGVAATLTEGTQYTVSGGSSTGATGTVNLAGGTAPYGAPAVGTTLLIRRVLPLVQEADFVNNDINDAEVSETALDKLTMIAQQISETSGRGVAIPAVETATDALTVLPFDRASKYLAFDANKEMIASDGPAGDNVPVSTFMATVLDDADAATARGTLGAAGSGAVTGSGLTMTTARLLGRTTASTGAVEEISIGAGLTLAAGSLSAPVAAASDTAAGVIEIADVSEMEAGSSATLAVTPGRQHRHPSAAKGWVNYDQASNVVRASFNVASVSDNSAGDFTVNWDTDFSSTYFANAGMAGGDNYVISLAGISAGATGCTTRVANTSTLTDLPNNGVVAFGDQ